MGWQVVAKAAFGLFEPASQIRSDLDWDTLVFKREGVRYVDHGLQSSIQVHKAFWGSGGTLVLNIK